MANVIITIAQDAYTEVRTNFIQVLKDKKYQVNDVSPKNQNNDSISKVIWLEVFVDNEEPRMVVTDFIGEDFLKMVPKSP